MTRRASRSDGHGLLLCDKNEMRQKAFDVVKPKEKDDSALCFITGTTGCKECFLLFLKFFVRQSCHGHLTILLFPELLFCLVVLENVFDVLQIRLKTEILERLDAVVRPDCTLA